jgi:signal transduction histidine kinase
MLGLGDALESYFRKAAARCEPPVTVSVRRSGDEPELTSEQSLGLYRICQEAINNVLKHSGAARAGLELTGDPNALRIAIWDNGRGLPEGASRGAGHGLRNMRYRADLIGAKVAWHPYSEQGGTRVEVLLSLPTASAPAVAGTDLLALPGTDDEDTDRRG